MNGSIGDEGRDEAYAARMHTNSWLFRVDQDGTEMKFSVK